jgi:hypothetical protein
MNIAPTIEGGLRIDPETPEDWHILRAIVIDASQSQNDLASNLGNLITDDRIADDWKENVVPDLRESFSDDLHHIQATIEAAAAFPSDSKSSIWITRDDATQWYSALNQARLALEDTHKFGPNPKPNPSNLIRFEAHLRSQFYCAIQSLLLQHSITL